MSNLASMFSDLGMKKFDNLSSAKARANNRQPWMSIRKSHDRFSLFIGIPIELAKKLQWDAKGEKVELFMGKNQGVRIGMAPSQAGKHTVKTTHIARDGTINWMGVQISIGDAPEFLKYSKGKTPLDVEIVEGTGGAKGLHFKVPKKYAKA